MLVVVDGELRFLNREWDWLSTASDDMQVRDMYLEQMDRCRLHWDLWSGNFARDSENGARAQVLCPVYHDLRDNARLFVQYTLDGCDLLSKQEESQFRPHRANMVQTTSKDHFLSNELLCNGIDIDAVLSTSGCRLHQR